MKRLFIFTFCILILSFLFSSSSYADVVRDESFHITSFNGFDNDLNPYVSSFDLPEDQRVCFLFHQDGSSSTGQPYGTYTLYTSYNGSVSFRRYVSGQTLTGNFSSALVQTSMYSLTPSGSTVPWGNNRLSVSSDYGSRCPIFNDFEDAVSYIVDGTIPEKPFYDEIKLDKFKVYMRGVWNWDLVRPQFNHVVVCPIWSNPEINDVEISIYAVDPSFRYNTVNYSFDGNMSGQMQSLDISGLTLHDQKFVVRATPFTSYGRGVAIQYEFTFPENFDQPIGQLVIPTDNHYPYSTTIDISGNDVPIEWTVTQTPIYVYETNNIENYYYGDSVSYPVPEITENTVNNYYETYVNNYYNTYNEIVNHYDVNFDIDISDVSAGYIQQTYDDFGNFFKGFGSFIGKLSLLFNGLFPFLSPAVSVILVSMVGLIVVGAVVILFLKVLHIL